MALISLLIGGVWHVVSAASAGTSESSTLDVSGGMGLWVSGKFTVKVVGGVPTVGGGGAMDPGKIVSW